MGGRPGLPADSARGGGGAARAVTLAGTGMAALYLLFYYVPISARHTVEVFHLHPLGEWSVESPTGLALFYALILAGLFTLYAAAARRLARTPEGGTGRLRLLVYGLAALALIVLVFLPRLLSKDVFDYMVHGRILALHRANPFKAAASAFGVDEFLRAMGWPQYTAIYGPGWISTCGLLAWLAPDSVPGSLIVYKLLFGLVHLSTGLVIGALLKGWGRSPLPGEMLYLWNPLVLLQTVGQAHNDGFLMLWALLGLLLIQRRGRLHAFYDEALGVVCLAISILVKYVTGPLMLFVLAARARQRGGARGLLRAAALAVIAVLVGLVGYMPYADGMDFLQFLRPYDHGAYQGGSLMVLHMALQKFIGEAGSAGELVADTMFWTGSGLAALTALLAVLLAYRTGREEDVPRHGLFVLLFYLLAAAALLRVSYGVWIVALAVLVAPGAARRAGLLLSASLMSLEIFYVYAIKALPTGVSYHREQAAATLVAVLVPISYLLARTLRSRDSWGDSGENL